MLRWLTARRALGVASVTSLVLVVADDDLGPVGIVIGVAIVTACLFALLAADRDGDTVPIGAVALAAGVVFCAAVIVAPRDSKDLWSYAMYGRILSVHHASPWVVTPAHFPADPYLARVASGWRHTTSIYGPLFELFAAAVTRAAGGAATAVRMVFTSTFAAAAGLAAWLVYRRTGRAALSALVVLHPAITIGNLAGGHNDILVGVGLLGAVLLLGDDRPVLAGLSAAAATLVKLTGGIGILALVGWTAVHRGRRPAARFAGIALGVVALAYLPLGFSGFSAFAHNRASLSRASAWQLPRLLTGLDPGHSPIRLGLPRSTTSVVITVGTLVAAALIVWVAVRFRHVRPPALSMVAAIGVYLVLAPYVLPWYPAWVIPALALVADRPAARVLALQASVLVVVYELKTQSLSGVVADAVWWLSVLVSTALVVAYAVALWREARSARTDVATVLTRPAG